MQHTITGCVGACVSASAPRRGNRCHMIVRAKRMLGIICDQVLIQAREIAGGFDELFFRKPTGNLWQNAAQWHQFLNPVPPMNRILTIEDDAVTAREIVAELTRNGLSVDWVDNGREGLERAVSGDYDLITLDRMLPELDGLVIVTTLRNMGVATPILMISALSDVDERVRGLRAGGDDYLTKPFATDEMAARVEVLLRRNNGAQETQTALRVADLELNLISREASRNGQLLSLLPTEYKLLEFLMRNSGQILSRMMIFEEVWGYHFDPGTNLIDVHIGRLRKKIDPPGLEPLIRTVRGSGYVIAEPR
ncbi:DNA-binding response regulator, OmpR family, contains REC and winged-helix (wHTH) domain [Pseudomonas sp. NFACC32-1]|nr:DNA-binding response regulator, OmpR family, contains REC and winged-helix (wHTH) domain [Pseudomonas sp. NFACC32-1]SFW74616.1 DNA-binding response regulator, OmpR family, contains REC and winged-helix (wHTH) domain [Pseudomonas sp. NFACC09-4]SFY06228.1 DNA-binding response regulator, OmpR family, contains REC and winged-helix (wHTH) domain [Pseudomonas sp. NFACC36]SIS24595.1 DNA-binding response regulator, OmpR family, contains REC and winged-helix (wHTH) domain [Pseudomonas sp. 7SR1]